MMKDEALLYIIWRVHPIDYGNSKGQKGRFCNKFVTFSDIFVSSKVLKRPRELVYSPTVK